MFLEKSISKKIDNLLEKKEYEKIMNSISSFQIQFVDSEIDRKSFQDFMLKSSIRFAIYRFVYEKYSSVITSEKEIFVSKLVTQAMSYMNEQNSKYNRPIFTNEKLLQQYFADLFAKLNDRMFSGMTIESKTQLSAISTLLDKRFSQLYYNSEIQLSTEFLTHSLNRTINNLGGRYTSDFNIKTQNRWSLECLGKSTEFVLEINKNRCRASSSYSKLCQVITSSERYSSIKELKSAVLEQYLELLETEISFESEFIDLRKTLESINLPDVYWIEQLSQEEKSHLRYYIELATNDLTFLTEFLDVSKIELINQPYLIITGNAGIGKSHLLADYAKKFTERGHATFLFLGSYFYNESQPSNQIMEWLRLPNSSFKSILEQLERKSVETGLRSIIFLDALNEGVGRVFWKERLNGLVKEIQEYPNIGIVLSVRSEYDELIIPDDIEEKLNFKKIVHTGLEGTVNDSIKAFCKYYKLAYPTVPSFNEEYNNPLFLKMVCQLLIDSNLDKFSSNFSIEVIMKHYISNLELILSSENRMNFDSRREVIRESILAIAELKIESKWSLLEYNTVYDRLIKVGRELAIDSSGNLLKELINEGLLQVIDMGENKSFLDFQFEKFSDFFIADYVYQKYVKGEEIDDLESVPELALYFRDDLSLRNNYGMLIMLSTLIANHEKKEINSYLPKAGNSNLIFEVIFESLPFRNSKSVSDRLIKFIEKNITTVPDLMKYFVYSQFQLSTNSDSPVNSKWLHEFLSKKTQQEIDLIWTINISKPYRTFVSQFAKWYRESYKIRNRTEAELILLQLGWILSSTNRYYRDQATIAIVKILSLDSDLIELFLSKFVNVNDRYVVERVMAAVYGAVTNITDNKKIHEISKCVYKKFFDVEEVVPHVLARDYGRQIMNYAIYCGALDRQEIDFSKVFPTYEGVWDYEAISDEQILELEKQYDEHHGFNSIVRSMVTNFGRAQGGYGDFGRYTFQSALSPWAEQFDLQDLSNIAVKRCLDLGYSPELFSDFDTMDNRYFDRHSYKEERIGKKYEWIAFHEMLAKISDNFIPYQLEVIFDDEYKEYLKDKGEKMFSLLEHGNLAVFNGEDIDESEHIVSTERKYQGEWQVWDTSIRDIDVTVIDENLPVTKNKLFQFSLPDYLTNEWILEKIGIKNLKYYLTTEVDSEKFYALSFYHDERRKNEDIKDYLLGKDDNLTIMGRAVFVRNSQLKKFHEEFMSDIGNVSSPSTHNIFLREYYWSNVYMNWEELDDYNETSQFYIHSSHCYGWEKSQQFTSLEEDLPNNILSMLMPSRHLVEFGNLKMDSDYYWRDDENNIICFDGRVIESESVLLGKKNFIDDFCLKNDCTIVWQCYYDKVGL